MSDGNPSLTLNKEQVGILEEMMVGSASYDGKGVLVDPTIWRKFCEQVMATLPDYADIADQSCAPEELRAGFAAARMTA